MTLVLAMYVILCLLLLIDVTFLNRRIDELEKENERLKDALARKDWVERS